VKQYFSDLLWRISDMIICMGFIIIQLIHLNCFDANVMILDSHGLNFEHLSFNIIR